MTADVFSNSTAVKSTEGSQYKMLIDAHPWMKYFLWFIAVIILVVLGLRIFLMQQESDKSQSVLNSFDTTDIN